MSALPRLAGAVFGLAALAAAPPNDPSIGSPAGRTGAAAVDRADPLRPGSPEVRRWRICLDAWKAESVRSGATETAAELLFMQRCLRRD